MVRCFRYQIKIGCVRTGTMKRGLILRAALRGRA